MPRSKAKGTAYELEVSRLLESRGITCSRVAAQAGMRGDAHDIMAVIGGNGMKLECKRRADGWRELYAWLGQADVLALRADRKPSLVVLTADRFLDLVGAKDG